MTRITIFVASLSLCISAFGDKPASADAVSFHKQVKPILQAHCQGCHQPANTRVEILGDRSSSYLLLVAPADALAHAGGRFRAGS